MIANKPIREVTNKYRIPNELMTAFRNAINDIVQIRINSTSNTKTAILWLATDVTKHKHQYEKVILKKRSLSKHAFVCLVLCHIMALDKEFSKMLEYKYYNSVPIMLDEYLEYLDEEKIQEILSEKNIRGYNNYINPKSNLITNRFLDLIIKSLPQNHTLFATMRGGKIKSFLLSDIPYIGGEKRSIIIRSSNDTRLSINYKDSAKVEFVYLQMSLPHDFKYYVREYTQYLLSNIGVPKKAKIMAKIDKYDMNNTIVYSSKIHVYIDNIELFTINDTKIKLDIDLPKYKKQKTVLLRGKISKKEGKYIFEDIKYLKYV